MTAPRTFEEWYELNFPKKKMPKTMVNFYRYIWTAATLAERERSEIAWEALRKIGHELPESVNLPHEILRYHIDTARNALCARVEKAKL